MHYTALTIVTFVAAVLAQPASPLLARQDSSISVETPSMTDANGNIVAYNVDQLEQTQTATGGGIFAIDADDLDDVGF